LLISGDALDVKFWGDLKPVQTASVGPSSDGAHSDTSQLGCLSGVDHSIII
jgi:hypothetical protein